MQIDTPRKGIAVFLPFALVALAIGCGGSELDLVPVSGTVLLDGKPLTTVNQGSVSFHGDSGKGNTTMHIPTGAIDSGGKFELITGGEKGAPVGWYKVLVSAFANKVEEGPVLPRKILDSKFYDLEKTDLSVEVVADAKPGHYDLKVTKTGR